jgi:hypothetical protein
VASIQARSALLVAAHPVVAIIEQGGAGFVPIVPYGDFEHRARRGETRSLIYDTVCKARRRDPPKLDNVTQYLG